MARSTTDTRLTFISLYEDDLSGLTKEYQVRYYLEDGSVDIGDTHTRKPILKRTGSTPGSLTRSDFVLGSKVVVFGRLLHLVRYADLVTKQLCEGATPTTSLSTMVATRGGGAQPICDTMYVVIAGRHLSTVGTALSVVEVELGFTISGLTAGTLPAREISALVSELSRNGDAAYTHVDGEHSTGPGMMMTQHTASRSLDTLVRDKEFRNTMVTVIKAAKPGAHRFIESALKRLRGSSAGGVWICASHSSCIIPLPAAQGGAVSQSTPAASALAAGSAAEAVFTCVEQRAARRYRGPGGASASNGSIALIKPHVLKVKEAGLVLQELLEGVAVSASSKPSYSGLSSSPRAVLGGLSLIALSVGEASSMLAPYRGVLESFSQVVAEVAAGPFIVVHLTTQEVINMEMEMCAYSVDDTLEAARAGIDSTEVGGYDTEEHHVTASDSTSDDAAIFDNLRQLCGPSDPAIAKLLRGKSIRARYGKTSVQNAIHCTDLPEDVHTIGSHLLGYTAIRRAAVPSDGCA